MKFFFLALLAFGPSVLIIYTAKKSNTEGIQRSRLVNVMLVISLLAGAGVGGCLLFLAAAALTVKHFVTFAAAVFYIILSILPLAVAFQALRALRGDGLDRPRA